MSTQFLLDEDDIKELTKLMLVMIETQESRKQLCRELGINPQEVSFIIGTSDDTFCTELIDCLNRYGYQEYLCKLCCDKLFPILNKSVYSHRISILKKIVEKLNCNCNQEKQNHPIPTVPNPDESKSESLLTKVGNVNKKLLACGAILLVGLPVYNYLTVIKEPDKPISSQQILRGTVEEVVNGDLMCYITMSTEDGRFTLGASFDLCEQKWVNQKVSVKAKPERVNDCQSAEPCGKTKDMLLITSMSKRY